MTQVRERLAAMKKEVEAAEEGREETEERTEVKFSNPCKSSAGEVVKSPLILCCTNYFRQLPIWRRPWRRLNPD